MLSWHKIVSACLVSLAIIGAHSGALAEKRVALVIGNSHYQHIARLANPANDARLMAETLRAVGFTLVGGGALVDLEKPDLMSAVRRFGTDLRGADVGLFYFAGHGVQVNGLNYLVPVNANPTREADVDFEFVDVALALRQMEAAGTRFNLVVLDACRNNPFGGRGLRDSTAGLAQMRAAEGTLISFATQPGNVAQDGSDGNSPFTRAFAQTIRKPGVGIFDAINEVGLTVKRVTSGSQQPWFSTSPIDGGFFFAGTQVAIKPVQGGAVEKIDGCNAARDHWQSVEAINTRAAYEDHLKRFPDCPFAGLAKAKSHNLANDSLAPNGSGMFTLASRSPSAESDVVKDFYTALGRGDGKAASSLVVPEKRSSKIYSPEEMTKFYSSLIEPLRLLDVVTLGNNKFQATYTFRTRASTCNGSATVSVAQRSGQRLIDSIRVLNGC